MSDDLIVPPAPGPLAESLGHLHVLCVGVSKQLRASGFRSLPQCDHDALAVRDAFADVFQLGAQARNVSQLTSKAGTVAKGSIIDALRQLATAASDDDRILFFFSGHGQRLGDKLYLVPEDAWDSDDPEALIEFDRVLEILNGSKARQKFIVLDACWCGPDVTHFKKFVPASFSKKFLEDYLGRTTGIAILTSSSDSQTSTTQSPNPKHSLFTHHFVAALRGHPDALDDRFLTLQKLFEFVSVNVQRDSKSYHELQEPVLRTSASGSLVLGDFRPIMNPAAFEVVQYPIDTIDFVEIEDLRVTDVLTNIKNWTYSTEYLASKVNSQLGDHYEERLGRLAARLRNDVGISSSDISIEGNRLAFPDGMYWIEYEADDKKRGRLMHRVSFLKSWFDRRDDIVAVLNALEMGPTEIHFELAAPQEPLDLIPGLEANGWVVMSQLTRKVEARRDSYRVLVEDSKLSFKGFSASELLGGDASSNEGQLASGVMALLSSARPISSARPVSTASVR